jgi:hypothetical protein
VSAVNDTEVEEEHSGIITHLASSADSAYNNIAIPSVTVKITDNDTSGGSGYIPPANPPRITVIAPTEGEVLQGDQLYLITWDTSGQSTASVNIFVSYDGGASFTTVDRGAPNNGSYLWHVPPRKEDTVIIRIAGTDFALSDVEVTSDTSGVFSISYVPPDVTDDFRPLPAFGFSPVDGKLEPITPVEVGDYIRSPYYSTVYYVDHGKVRRPFLNPQTYFTYETTFKKVKMVTNATLPVLPLERPMLPKPQTVLLKFISSPPVYVIIIDNMLRHIPSETTAARLFGEDWADYVLDADPSLVVEFSVGAPLTGYEVFDRSLLKKREDLHESP